MSQGGHGIRHEKGKAKRQQFHILEFFVICATTSRMYESASDTGDEQLVIDEKLKDVV